MSPHLPTIHPEWCDPLCCESTDVGVQHFSAPIIEAFADEIWQFILVRMDAYARPRETSRPELLIEVISTTLDGKDARHVLRPEEVRKLADRLMTEYHRAQFLSRPAFAGQDHVSEAA